MHVREKKDQESERQRDEFFNKLRPMVPRQQWRAKAVYEALKETRVEATKEQGTTGQRYQSRLRSTDLTDQLHQLNW
jgi:hypothetical protein